jgi:CBS domain-containing protein
MTTLRARDLMTAEVARVPPETPVRAIARLFADRGISAVSVTDAGGTLLGIVTESDLIRRLADEDEPSSEGWFGRLFSSPNRSAERYARSHGAKASEVMTEHVVTVGPEASAAHIAHVMDEHRIRRVLVTEGGQLLGLVSRSDLVRALVAPQQTAEGEVSDERIRRAVLAAMQRESWADTLHTAVDVRNGVVEFYGFSRSETVSHALCVLAENVPGVKSVLDHTRHRAMLDPS